MAFLLKKDGSAKLKSYAKPFCYSLILSVLFFATFIYGWKMSGSKFPGSFALDIPGEFMIRISCLLFIFLFIFLIMFLLFSKSNKLFLKITDFNPVPFVEIGLDKKSLILCSIIIFVCWLPWIIFSYPGNMNYDTVNQIWQYATESPTMYTTMGVVVDFRFIDHHPVFDTLIYGLFIDLGNTLGSQNVGLFIFVILQSLMSAAILSLACCYLSKLGVPNILRIIAVFFVALFPPFAQFSATVLKDSLFAPLFLLYFVGCIEIFLSDGKSIKNLKFLASFVVVSMLCILTKKTGLYIIGISGIVFLISYRSYWKQFLVSVLIPISVCAFLIPTFIYPLIDVSPGGRQETLGPFFQQTAFYFLEHPDDVTDEEYEVIRSVLRPEEFEKKYDKTFVDPIKNTYNLDADTKDLVNYIKVWINQGLRHPVTYLKATLQVNARLISPVQEISYYGDTMTQEQYDSFEKNEGYSDLSIYKPDKIKEISDKARSAYLGTIKGSHLLTALFSRGLWGFWIPVFCVFYAFCYQKKSLIALVPVIISLLFLFISPTSSSRYILPLLYVDLSVIGIAIHAAMQKSKLFDQLKPESSNMHK